MLSVALRTLRTRWTAFAASFVALALGVGLITMMGLVLASSAHAPQHAPERFRAAPVVVHGADTLRVRTPSGVRTAPLSPPRPVPAGLVARLGRIGAVTADRSFAVSPAGGPSGTNGSARAADRTGLTGHPWASAGFAGYRLTAGHPPAAPDQVVVAGAWAHPGQRVALRAAGGTVRDWTVVGTVAALPFERAVFFTGAEAARLSPASPRDVVVDAPAAAVTAAVAADPAATGVRVLTGDDRRLADPDRDGDHEALVTVDALLGTAGGVTCFVSVYVVASTFAFSVAQRRREWGLLRTAGATPRQVRRIVHAEALVVGSSASATGCVLGRYGAPRLAGALVQRHVAPVWFGIGGATWPYWTAFGTGLLVALAGVWAAGRRAGRVPPAEALRDAAVDSNAMAPGRLLAGGALLLGSGYLAVSALVADPGEVLHRKTYTVQPMVLVTAAALLAPLLVRPLARLLAWLPAQLLGATGMLAGENTATAVRRTTAVAAPVLVSVALAGSLLGTTATINAAKAAELRGRTGADFVITAGGAGFTPATVARVAAVPGTDTAAFAATTVHTLEDQVALTGSPAEAASPAALATVTRLPVVAGRLGDLDDHGIVVNQEWARHTVGQYVRVWLGDGTPRTLRIVAVLRQGTGDNGAYVTPANARGAAVDRIDVALRPGADRTTAAASLRNAVAPSGGLVLTDRQWVAAQHPTTSRQTRIGFWLVLGIALLYTAIALAGTMVMATSERTRDLAVLRLAGATVRQVLRLLGAEAVLAVTVGAVMGAMVTGVDLAVVRVALALLSVPGPVTVPWAALGAVTGTCAVVAVTCAVVPGALMLRRRGPAPVRA
ncbi:putative ABC transport system permease protein [Actinacidiphila yanglinensis]|uniref:Putative ABC transport system permease protein n=1 Tax=Actinacidiphila yanglinensis TaxID=310779 RepID=A0A1H5YWK4_9ACTN|nr:ABC transporter permease [Actinacidiphila yanglinensis]SEG28404.1 putative ABC transport system permease protein [Actinacidiphila yanglinensis]